VASRLAQTNASPQAWEPLLRDALAFALARAIWADDGEGAGDRCGADDEGRVAARHAHLEAERQRWFERGEASWQRENVTALHTLRQHSGGASYTDERIEKAYRVWQHFFAAADPAAALSWDLAKLFTRGWLSQQQEKSPSKPLARVPALPLFDDLQTLVDAQDSVDNALRAEIARLKRRMLDHAARSLREAKLAQGVMSFQDMLVRTHERLHADPALVAAVRQRFPAALVDEFQDTDPVQLGIFERVYGSTAQGEAHGGCVFLVGDPKQAIYAFRGADLASYLHARDKAGAGVWSLDRNQRASPELLHALNALFSRHRHVFGDPRLAFRASVAGAAPRKAFVDRRSNAVPGVDHEGALRIWSLPPGFDSTGAAKRAAARACAADIARTLHAAQGDLGHTEGLVSYDGRRLRGGDIAVLVRTNAEGRTMRRALAGVGVASVELSPTSVFASLDAAEIELLLHAMLDPGHGGKLRAAMATTLLGVDANRLAALQAATDDEATPGPDPAAGASAALESTLERLLAWRTTWQRHGIAAMLARLLDDAGAAARLLPTDTGERRMTNLLHLMELLGRQERDTRLPRALLRWLSQQRADAHGREETQLRLESDRRLVQIVTVHRAKGLQYPIVMLPFLWSDPFLRVRSGARRWHDDDDEQVLDFRDTDQLDDDVKARMRDEANEETLRLLYVALTRAEHRCTLVVDAHPRTTQGSRDKNANLQSMLNWIVCGQGAGFEAWRKPSGKAADTRSRSIEQAWRALAQATPNVLLEPLPSDDGTAMAMRNDDAVAVQRFDAPGPIGASWRLGSFSSFLRADAGAAPELLDTLDPAPGSGIDRDAGPVLSSVEALAGDASIIGGQTLIDEDNDDKSGEVRNDARAPAQNLAQTLAQTLAEARASTPLADDDILRFPRGPAAGDAMHAALERADFTQPRTWPAACAAALRLHPQRTCPQAQAMLERMLGDLANVDIAPGLALRQVGTAQRLDELEFDLPLPALRLDRLEARLLDLGLAVPPLGTSLDASRAFHGHLRGFVDTVFEQRGRYYLADWKSNHLGDAPAHYAQPGLLRTIARHGYHLQHVLYAIALLRHLRRCLGNAQGDAAWGGAFVLFVRGIRPGWLDAQGRPTGVFHHRLEPAVLDELARCFG
jgi:exodeoxyribonuclease V beta subunit